MAGCAEDVTAWLDKLGLNEYTEKFLAAGYSSLQQCLSLSKNDLSVIGIGKVGHVNRLFRDIERMKVDGVGDVDSPPRSSSSSPDPPPVVKPTTAPAVPPRRTLPRKPLSDGSIMNLPPPKLAPRKGSLRKSTSAHFMKPTNVNLDDINEKPSSMKIPSSQSLNDICDTNQSLELNDISSGLNRAPPPIAPRPSRKPVVPHSSRNGQVSSGNGLATAPTHSDKGVSAPPVPIRRITTPIAEGEETTETVKSTNKEKASVPPLPAQRTSHMSTKDEVLRADVPLLDEDDELPPPLPVKKANVLDPVNSNTAVDREAVSPDPSSVKVLSSPSSEMDKLPSLPVKANEPPLPPARANEPPPLPVRAEEPPPLSVKAEEPPPLPVRAEESSVQVEELPPLPIKADGPPLPPVRTTEPLSLPVRAEEFPTVSPTVEDSQDIKESSQKPPPPVRIRVKISVGDDEVFEEEEPSAFEDHLSEDEESPPPLPVKKNERTVVVPPPLPPPPPPEESDDEESPPLPIKKMVDTSPVVVPVSSQDEPKHSIPPPPPSQDSSEDEVVPPLPVKKQSKEDVPAEENRVPEARPIQSLPLSKVGSDSTSSVVSVPSATGSPTGKKQPPIPPRRTVSAVTPPSRSVESDSEDIDSPPPPLPERKTLMPPPPPPSNFSDSDSEDDGKFSHKPSLVAVKSVPLRDGDDLSSGNIMLSRSKDSMDTSDSSDDEVYHRDTRIISQPSLDSDTIALSSTPVTPDDGIGEVNCKNLASMTETGDVMPSLHSQKRAPPPVKRRLGSKVSSPPTLPQPVSTPPPVRVSVPSSMPKSASYDTIAFLSDDPVTSMYSQIGLPPEQIRQQDSITSMYSEVGLPSSQRTTQKVESMYSQLGGGVSPQMKRAVNGDLGRPISVVNPDIIDGNMPSRIRSMSELPSKLRKKKAPDFQGIHEPTATIVERPIRKRVDHQSSVLSPSASRRGERNYSQVPKTKEGWLHKRGGKHGDKPWTSRWFTFDGHDLKYFKSPSDKASECLKSIKLIDMIDVKTTTDLAADKKLCRFDLVATNRVFQLASESQDEVTQWVDVLEAAIKCRSDVGEVEGGSMNNPDKVGFLQKQGHGMIKTWERRYVALKGSRFAYYESKDDFTSGRPINTLEMGLTAVKPDMSGKYRFIITTNRKKEYVFQAVSDTEMREWIEALQKGIMQGLESRIGHNVMPEMNTSSKEIMDRLCKNPSNATCAECSSTDPVWASVNLGVMLCINCSGVHRSMGTHISKVRSTELDQHIWTDSLIDLIVAIGNKRSNEFWEKHCQTERLAADVERDIRENFIRAKYELKAWIPRDAHSLHEVLNKKLCQVVKTDDVMATLELIVHGANVNFLNTSIKGPNNTPLLIAQEYEQPLQMELLIQNGAVVPGEDDDEKDEPVNRQGYLFKTGSERTGWKRRYCSLDKTGFKYYKSDNNSEVLGEFPVEEMLSVNICEDESAKDPHYKYCFEVATAKRPYLFCAEREFEMQQWVGAFQKIIPVNAEDILGFDKIGYIYHKTPGGWKRKWCTLKKKDMWFYKRHEKEVIDLRKAIELRAPDPQGNFEAQCSFQIVALGKTHFLKADNVSEADAWYSALKHTQVSGLPLQDQELTNNGIPIIVHKCVQFVESHGIDSEGIYRLSGNKTRVQKLILAFDQDAKGFIIDPETYLVNDVAGALKQFFRSLPDPLLTHHLYASFINAAQIQDEEEKRTQIQCLVEQLPAVNRETLKRLIGHLKKVVDNVAINKMTAANMVRIFGPTLMTVDSDESTFLNANYEFCVIEMMFRHYLWMFQIDEIEQRKEEEMQKAMKKLEMAQQMQKQHSIADTRFLVTVYINSKDGQLFTSKVSQSSTAGDLADEVACSKALQPDCYALHIVLGNSEAERTLHPTERVLTVMQTVQCDFFFCLKHNVFAERVKPYMSDSTEAVTINLREKKRWRKYPCAVKSNHFVIYRDTKLNHELSRTSVHEFDMFFGTMSDVKNPAPTGHQLYLKTRVEDQSKYICADCEEDLLKCAGRIAHAKYPEGFPMMVIPTNPISPEEMSPPVNTTKPRSVSEDWTDPDIYVNVKLSSKRSTKTLGGPVPPELLRELSSKLKKT